MLYITLGFFLGFFIPYVVRRYFKIKNEPLGFAAELYWIFHINKHVSKQKYQTNQKYLQLKNRYFMRSLGWGIITSAIFFLISTTKSTTLLVQPTLSTAGQAASFYAKNLHWV